MTSLDDDLLAALRAARPDPGYQPSATSPQAQAMLARVLRSAEDPAARRQPPAPGRLASGRLALRRLASGRLALRRLALRSFAPGRWRRPLVLAGVPALAVAVAATVLVASMTTPGHRSPPSSPPAVAASLRAEVLDAFERDGGDIIYTTRTFQFWHGPTEDQQIWTYPAVQTAGKQVRVRLFEQHDGAPVEDTGSVYVAGPQSDQMTQSTTSGPRFAEITDVEYATRTWSRLRSSTPLVAANLDPDTIRLQITSGGFTVVGAVRLQGRAAIELTWTRRLERNGHSGLTTHLWVDAQTYMPLRSVTTQWAGPSRHHLAILTVAADYRILTATPANLGLLNPPIPAGFTRTATSPHYAPYTG
jgi:hypothetical protein